MLSAELLLMIYSCKANWRSLVKSCMSQVAIGSAEHPHMLCNENDEVMSVDQVLNGESTRPCMPFFKCVDCGLVLLSNHIGM